MIYCTTWDWKAGITDSQGIVDLYKQWTGEERTPENIFNKKTIIAKVANMGGISTLDRIVGVAELIVIDDWVWHRRWGLVENVYVHKQYRRQGIGSQLMKHVESQAMALGCEFIKLTSRKEEGKALYRSLGYEEGSYFRKELK